jgi:hypothetical protein
LPVVPNVADRHFAVRLHDGEHRGVKVAIGLFGKFLDLRHHADRPRQAVKVGRFVGRDRFDGLRDFFGYRHIGSIARFAALTIGRSICK